MKLTGLMPVRNEDYCLGLTLRAALLWCDTVIVGLHACTDGSKDIVEAVIRENERGRVIVIHESDPTWDEMKYRSTMLAWARQAGAQAMAIVDADEVVTGNLVSQENCVWPLDKLPANGIMQFPMYNLRGSLTRYHADGVWGNRVTDVVFRDNPLAQWSGDCFHHRQPQGVKWAPYRPIQHGQGGVLHLWGASERRLRAKQALYKVTERLRWPNKSVAEIDRYYNLAIYGDPRKPEWGTPATWTYADVPEAWLAPYKQWLKHVDLETAPWQECEVGRLIAQHGLERFDGLDLFEVA